ncbi:MAG TPA: hypothetical protein VFD84_15385 [Candidatus Binatia bacterium]|jgi:hypothetical protein|nr:hypothetical protein [Candidatus Binatia bacterium]
MRTPFRALALALVVVAVPAWAVDPTATELKKELLPKIKKAQAEGKDLGEAAEEYKQGDEALKQGLQEEALEHFKKAKAAMPADAQ